jgi:hypothetical protein
VADWDEGCVPYPVLGPGDREPEPRQENRSKAGKNRSKVSKKRGKANAKVPNAANAPNAMMSAIFVPLQGGGFYLSAGDADSRAEPRIGRWAALRVNELKVTSPAPNHGPLDFTIAPRILKISHHGSRTSSDPDFLKAIQPTEAWISSGAGNRYGHPSAVVLARLARFGVPVRRTDEEGALQPASALHSKK